MGFTAVESNQSSFSTSVRFVSSGVDAVITLRCGSPGEKHFESHELCDSLQSVSLDLVCSFVG